MRRPRNISDGEFTIFDVLDVVVETVRQAIGKLPSERKWSVGMPGSATAKNQVSSVDPLIVVLLSKIGSLKLAQRFCCTLNVRLVAVAARMTPEVLVPASDAE